MRKNYIKYLIITCILSFVISCGPQKKYVEYKVKTGETLRSIAKDNDLNLRDILKLNPAISARPATNSIIYLPSIKKKIKTAVLDEKKDDDVSKELDSLTETDSENLDLKLLKENYIIHEVKKGDTFYSITRFYNVTEESLKELNPLLKEGLKQDTFIKIKKIEETNEDVDGNLIYQDVFEQNITIDAALMLPFLAEKLDTVTPNLIFDNNRLANIVTDFYLGAQLAIDSLQQQGININYKVFDTGLRNTKVNDIIVENKSNNFDVIFGPIYSDEAEKVADFLRVPVVFPVFSRNQNKFNSSKLIKTQPETITYRNAMISYLHETYENQHIVLVANDSIRGRNTINLIKQHDSINNITLVTSKQGYLEKKDLVNAMKSQANNWIIVDTEDNILAESTVNSLIALPTVEEVEKAIEKALEDEKEEELGMQGIGDSTIVRLFSFEKGRTFSKIDNNKLAQLNYTFSTDTFSNELTSRMKDFNSSYFRRNYSLPSFYATKGFDITYDILMRLASGKELRSTFNDGFSMRLESKFDFDNILFEPTNNNGVFIVKYNEDLTLTKLK